MGGLFGLLFWWVNGGSSPPPPTAIPPVCIEGLAPSLASIRFGEPVTAGVVFAPSQAPIRFGDGEAC